jgi:peptide/nickel transport system permease protein
MLSFIIQRVLAMSVVMLIVASLVFVIIRLAPGDPAIVMLGDLATEASLLELRRALGLDQPLIYQYLIYIKNILSGDLGQSIFFGQPVLQVMFDRVGLTFTLTLMAILVAVSIGVPVGIISAVERGKFIDQALTTGAMFAASVPSFWIGLTLMAYFSVDLQWLPVAGYGPPDATFLERLRFLILPSIALGIPSSALIMRFTRNAMLEALSEDYVRTARAKGLGRGRVVLKHALRNSLVQIITVIGLTLAVLVGGAVVTESVFALPGVGALVVNAVLYRDYPIIQGALLLISGLYVVINLAIDILYAVIDPRIRY